MVEETEPDDYSSWIGQKHYILLEAQWVRDHRFYMGEEARRRIDSNAASFDFYKGNDHFLDKGDPFPDVKHHRSKRNLTWENEFAIFYFNNIIAPAIRQGKFPHELLNWASEKAEDLKVRGLAKHVYSDLDLVDKDYPLAA